MIKLMLQHAKKHPGVGQIRLSVLLSDCSLSLTTCSNLNKLMMYRNTESSLRSELLMMAPPTKERAIVF